MFKGQWGSSGTHLLAVMLFEASPILGYQDLLTVMDSVMFPIVETQYIQYIV